MRQAYASVLEAEIALSKARTRRIELQTEADECEQGGGGAKHAHIVSDYVTELTELCDLPWLEDALRVLDPEVERTSELQTGKLASELAYSPRPCRS